MIKTSTVKTSICLASMLLTLGWGVTASAETISSDTGVAGITVLLDTYYKATAESNVVGAPEKYIQSLILKNENTNTQNVVNVLATQSDNIKNVNKKDLSNNIDSDTENSNQTDINDQGIPVETVTSHGITEVESPYENLGISIATNYVNIRKEPNTDSEILGKLYRGCATDILGWEGDWVKIHSGKVDGYIKAEHLAIGKEAEKLVDEFADKYATVTTATLRVREKQSIESKITTLIPEGETYYIIEEYDQWVKIMIDEDESGKAETGYVSKDYISIDVEFDFAVSIEEEKAKEAAEKAAKEAEEKQKAEADRQRKEREAEAARKAAAAKAAQESKSSSSSSSNSSSSSQSSGSATGQKIADYGVKFIGNPYKWGGTSLTNGADCSGFVQSLYAHFGITINRDSRSQASYTGYTVDINDRQPGDLIFYRNSSGTVNHVALYIGNNKVVHAKSQKDDITISSYNYRSPYKVKRVIKN